MLSTPYSDNLGIGTVTIEVTSSTILNSAATNKLLVLGDGIIVEDIIAETDWTGLAAGTLFQVKKTDTKGAVIVFSHAISALGANATFDMTTATTKNRSYCKGGTYLTVFSTGADCTGAGVIRLTFKFRRENSNSGLQAV